MAPKHRRFSVSPYDPRQLIASDAAISTPSPVVPETGMRARARHVTRHDYKPTALRWWFHGVLIASLSALIGLTEYTIRTLQVYNEDDLISQLWSTRVRSSYREAERKAADTDSYFQPIPRTFGNTTTVTSASPTTTELRTTGTPYLNTDKTTITSILSPTISSHTQRSHDSGHVITVTLPTSDIAPFTETIASSTDSSAYLQTRTTSSPKTVTDPKTATSTDGSAYLQIGTTPSPQTVTDPKTTTSTDGSAYLQTGTTSSPKIVTDSKITTDATTTSAVSALKLTSISYLVTEQISTTKEIESWTETPSTVIGTQETDSPSGNILGPTIITITSETAPGKVQSMTITQVTKTWAPSITTIQQSRAGLDGQGTVHAETITLPGGTSIFQSTIPVSSGGYYETVIPQAEMWPPSESKIEHTTTNADGQTIVQTLTTMSSGGTSVVQSPVSVLPGETLVTVPAVMPTTIGASTEVVQTTLFDSQGDAIISSYTTLLGGTPTVITRFYVVATSLPPDDTVLTIPTVVPTTIGGTTEVQETILTDAHGVLTTSSYTTTVVGTPTSTTLPVVVAVSVASGDVLITVSTVVPTTIGGTTEVARTAFTNSQGQLTTSSYTTVLGGTPTSTTEWTIVPTPTGTDSASNPSNSDTGDSTKVMAYGLGSTEYILGTFMPTILAVLVAFFVKLISINARLMQPFHALATADEADGATPESSIFLRFYSWSGAFSIPRAVMWRQPIIVVSDLLVLGAALLTPIAAETVSVHIADGCHSHCSGNLGVSIVVGRVLEALMGTMVVLLLVLVVLLSVLRWRTGVSQNPWSIAGMASLCLDPETRDKLRSIPRGLDGSVGDTAILKALGKSRYALGDSWDSSKPETASSKRYGVIVAGHDGTAKQLLERGASGVEEAEEPKAVYKRTQPFVLLTWWGRCLLLFVFSCVLIILTYYENSSGDTGFERFMDSQGFGVRFFFTALGVVLGGCMESVFRCVAIISPYLQLSNNNLPAGRSILLSPPTNAFYGIHSAIRQRHLLLGVLSFTTILGELFLPVTLSHVPFSLLETYETQLVCAWLSIAIVGLMILVLASSFLTRWPHMPVDPRTVAGAMFYVCDSWMQETLPEGMSTVGKKDRDLDVKYLRLRYKYGMIKGAVGGKERMGVDMCDDDMGEAAVMRSWKIWYS